jgi:hypothetical protein
MTAVDILLTIYRLWKDDYCDFPNLKRYAPVEVLARLPEKNERYGLGEEGLMAILREVG